VAIGDCIRGFYDVVDNAKEWKEDSRSGYWKRRNPKSEPKRAMHLVLDFDIDR
jgi:hypothetical protein